MTVPDPWVTLGPRGRLGVGLAVLVGVALRVLAVARLGPHSDEAASVLAAIQTARHGVPRLPSGILYTQGMAQSYLLAPLAWLGLLGGDLVAPRLASLVIGLVLLAAGIELGRRTLGSTAGVVVFAWLLALDPSLVTWSALVRPYALVACANLLVVLGFVDVIANGARRANVAWVVGAFSVGVYAHLTAALVWPALALVVLTRDDRWRRDRWALLGAMLAVAGSFLLMNTMFGVSSRGGAVALPVQFVGDHLIDLRHMARPEIAGWQSMYDGSAIEELMPVVVALAIGWGLARPRAWAGLIAAAFAAPVATTSALIDDQQGRYLLTAAPFAWWLVASAAETAWAEGRRGRAFAAALVGAGLVSDASGLGHTWSDIAAEIANGHKTPVDVDYQRAVAFVRQTQTGVERPVVFTMLTPVVWVGFGGDVDIRFLSGSTRGLRAQRYVLWGPAGPVDWWIGDPALPTVEALCDALRAAPGASVILDGYRLAGSDGYFGYAGPYTEVILGTTEFTFHRLHSATVKRVKPVGEWTPAAARLCRPPDANGVVSPTAERSRMAPPP